LSGFEVLAEYMLALIPLIDLVAIYVALRCVYRDRDWRESALAAAVIWGTLVALSTELLGLFHVIQRQTIGSFWLIALGFSLYVIYRQRRNISFKVGKPRVEGALAWSMLAVVAFYLAITFFIAIVAPPNTNDSMQYHMSRVMHWIVNRSVDFFPTSSDRQLWMPPFAEYAILHFLILAGSDLFANLVQWLAMAGSVIGVSLIASLLGARQKGQIFAALFAVTLPMGVLQSTSTQTDYAAAFWGVCFAFFAISESNRLINESPGRLSTNSILLALAFGLGILTKGTFVVCATPFLFWLLGVLVWKRKWKIAVGLAVLGLAGLLLLNASLWWKNYRTFDNPLGPATGHLGSTLFTPGAVFSTGLRNAAMQMAFDKGPANKVLYISTLKIHELLGLDINDPRITLGTYRIRQSVHEDFAGNNWHFILSAISVIYTLVVFSLHGFRKWNAGRGAGSAPASSGFSFYIPFFYTAAVILGYVLFSALFKWQDTDSRLLLPWFLMVPPLTGWVFDRINRFLRAGLTILLTLSSLTVLLSNPSRPLIVTGQNESILLASRTTTRFNNSPEIMNEYISVAVTARDLKCQSIGLSLDSSTPEYLIWAILSPSGQNLKQVQNLLALPETEQYATPGFRPCAVICNICRLAKYMGYENVLTRGSLQLYAQP
jgi:hypothetical protein